MRDVLVYLDSGMRHSEAGWAINMDYVDRIENMGAACVNTNALDVVRADPDENDLMKNSCVFMADLDGTHALDPAISARIGYWTAKELGPIFALRSDVRCGENIGCMINPQLEGYITQTGGKLITKGDGEKSATDIWFDTFESWAREFDSAPFPKPAGMDLDIKTAYVANQFGFSTDKQKRVLDFYLDPLREAGLLCHNPFEVDGEKLDFEKLATLKEYKEVENFWREFDVTVTPTNNDLMKNSGCMLAFFNPAYDDGVCGEIGYYAGKGYGPIFALNDSTRYNVLPEVRVYIEKTGGAVFEGENSRSKWTEAITNWVDTI